MKTYVNNAKARVMVFLTNLDSIYLAVYVILLPLNSSRGVKYHVSLILAVKCLLVKGRRPTVISDALETDTSFGSAKPRSL